MSEISAAAEGGSRESEPVRGLTVAKYLVAFIFAINVCFVAYMMIQFFAEKPYGNGLHAAYFALVVGNALLLGGSTKLLWKGNARTGSILFFAAVGISYLGNLITQALV